MTLSCFGCRTSSGRCVEIVKTFGTAGRSKVQIDECSVMVLMKPRSLSGACLRYRGAFGHWWTFECLLDHWSCSNFGSGKSHRCCTRHNLDFLVYLPYFADLDSHPPSSLAARCLLAYPYLWFRRQIWRHPYQRSSPCWTPQLLFNNETKGDTIQQCWRSSAARACSACAAHWYPPAWHLPVDLHDWWWISSWDWHWLYSSGCLEIVPHWCCSICSWCFSLKYLSLSCSPISWPYSSSALSLGFSLAEAGAHRSSWHDWRLRLPMRRLTHQACCWSRFQYSDSCRAGGLHFGS